MNNFEFSLKTRIFFGKDKENELGKIVSSYGYKKVLVIIGKSSVKKTGLLDKSLKLLSEEGIEYKLFEGVQPNPEIDYVRERLQEVRDYQPDMILAIGGGSVMDTSKSFAAAYYYDGDPFDFNLKKVAPKKSLPVGVILTISASGSESSTSCVMSDSKTGIKSGFNSEHNVPVFAIENPELTYTLPKDQTGYGIVDMMMHTLERYFCASSENEPADRFSEGLLRSVVEAGIKVNIDPLDYESRGVLMFLSSLSHDGLTGVGKTTRMVCHAFEHALSGLYPEVAHGAGLAVIWPNWAEYYVEYDVDKFDTFAKNVFHSFIEDKKENAKMGIRLVREFFDSLNMPSTFEDLGLKEVDIDRLVNILTNDGTRVIDHHKKVVDQDVAREIFLRCTRR